VTQVGDAASVQLSFDYASGGSDGWIDFHNLLRINGIWKPAWPRLSSDNLGREAPRLA
jgi:hypothetical protein